MTTQAFSTSPYGKALFNAYGVRRPTVAILGDSYGNHLAAIIQYACARYYAADIHFDHRTNANGGRLYCVGGTTPAQMVTTQIPQFQANPADIAFIWTGYNITINSLALAQGCAADIITTVNACLAAGAKLVVICSVGPKPSGGYPWAHHTANTLLEAYARATPGVLYLDTNSVLVDPASVVTNAVPFRSPASGTLGAYTADNIHPGGRAACVAIAQLLWPVLERVARKRLPRASINPGQFAPATTPDINLLGDAGNMTGTSGTLNGSNDTNVAGTSYAKWAITRSGAEVVITPSIVTGADGFLRQRMTLSGTTTVGGWCMIQCIPTITNVNNSDATRLYDSEAVIELNGVTGLYEISMVSGGVTSPSSSGGNGNPAYQWPDASIDGPLFYYGLYPLLITGNNPFMRFVFYVNAGVTLAGYIDISRASIKRVAP